MSSIYLIYSGISPDNAHMQVLILKDALESLCNGARGFFPDGTIDITEEGEIEISGDIDLLGKLYINWDE